MSPVIRRRGSCSARRATRAALRLFLPGVAVGHHRDRIARRHGEAFSDAVPRLARRLYIHGLAGRYVAAPNRIHVDAEHAATEICLRCPEVALLSGDDTLTLPFAQKNPKAAGVTAESKRGLEDEQKRIVDRV